MEFNINLADLIGFDASKINWEGLYQEPAATPAAKATPSPYLPASTSAVTTTSTSTVRTSATRTPTSVERAKLISKMEEGEQLSQDEMKIVGGQKDKNVQLSNKNMTAKEQLLLLKQNQKELKNTLSELEKQQEILTKTPEEIAAEQAAQEAQTGKIPLAAASGYGTTVMGNIPGEKPKEGVPPLGAASGYGTTVKGNIPGEKPTEGVIPLGAFSGYGSTQPDKNFPSGPTGPATNFTGGGGTGITNVETNFTTTVTTPTTTVVTTPTTTTTTTTTTTPTTTVTTPTTTPSPSPDGPEGLSTNIDVLKAMLLGMGFNASIVDSSSAYLLNLLKDGLDYDNAVSVFLNLKDYTTKDGQTLRSPFYEEYGYLNEGLTRAKPPAELYNAVEGYKEIVGKYNLNNKFISKSYIKDYVKNNVTVADLDERANTARLKAVNADPAYLESLRRLGYISGSTDLTDFFMDPTVGQETLEQRRGTAAFATEAIKRAQQGVQFNAERFGQITAGLVGAGLSEAQIGINAAQGFENIADQLLPTQRLASIYEKLPTTELGTIQAELEAEQFGGTASQRRKKLKELETLAFAGTAGTSAYSLKKGSAAGQI